MAYENPKVGFQADLRLGPIARERVSNAKRS